MTTIRGALVLSLIAYTSTSEPPPPSPVPVPPVAVTTDASPIASGTILRERPLERSPNSFVVTANAIYFSALSPGVFMLRDDKAKQLDDSWVTRLVGDDQAIYYVSRKDKDGRLMRQPFVGDPRLLVEWNGWVKAIDDTDLYLQAFESKAAIKLPKQGGAPVPLPCTSGMAVDLHHLYCLDQSELVRYDKAGRQKLVLARVATGRLTEGPVVTDRYVYASTEGDAEGKTGWSVVRVPKAGGAVEVVAPQAGNVYELVAAGPEAYWVETKHPTTRKMIVRRMADTDKEPSDFADGFGYARALVITATTVFVADSEPNRIVELKR